MPFTGKRWPFDRDGIVSFCVCVCVCVLLVLPLPFGCAGAWLARVATNWITDPMQFLIFVNAKRTSVKNGSIESDQMAENNSKSSNKKNNTYKHHTHISVINTRISPIIFSIQKPSTTANIRRVNIGDISKWLWWMNETGQVQFNVMQMIR